MTNPILIFVDETKFPKVEPRRLLRSAITAEGGWGPIDRKAAYALIILGDKDSFEDLEFSHNGSEPVMGAEHRNCPVRAHLPQLKAKVSSYEKTCEFSHIPGSGSIFDLLQGIFAAASEAERKPLVVALVDFVQSQGRWGAITSFIVNEQIRVLGGTPLPRRQLPVIAQLMTNRLKETRSVEQTLDEFLPSRS